MPQQITAKFGNEFDVLELPSAREYIVPGVYWGDHTHLFTPACWKVLCWLQKDFRPISFRVGDTLREEICACILGGYGIPSEVGLAAFHRVKETGLLNAHTSADEFQRILTEPLEVGKRRSKYRFAAQKSRYLSSALKRLAVADVPSDALTLRNWLLEFEGIGYKTASWITRNWLQSDEVAIIDIHIHRAGLLMRLYDEKHTPARDYLEMEKRFLEMAKAIEIKTSELDVLIWQEMKFAGGMALRRLNTSSLKIKTKKGATSIN